jgi:hypothetical protein
VIDEDSEREKNVLNVTHENRKRANNESITNRRIFRRLQDKATRKIYQELHDAAIHELSSIQSRDKILSNAYHVRNVCENSSNQ